MSQEHRRPTADDLAGVYEDVAGKETVAEAAPKGPAQRPPVRIHRRANPQACTWQSPGSRLFVSRAVQTSREP